MTFMQFVRQFSIFLVITLLGCSDSLSDINVSAVGKPPENAPAKVNKYLASEKLAVSHLDPAQSDNFSQPVLSGVFNVDLMDVSMVRRISSGPANTITLKSKDEDMWWGISSGQISYIDGRDGEWRLIASYKLPNVPDLSHENFDYVLNKVYQSELALERDYKDRWAPTTQQNPTHRMLMGNGSFAVVDKDGYLYVTASDNIFKLQFNEGGVSVVNNINVKQHMELPRGIDRDLIAEEMPSGIVGLNMAYDGTLMVGTLFGIMALDRSLNVIIDNIALPLEQFFHDLPPKTGVPPDFISRSFAIDKDNSIFLASSSHMNKIIWNGKLFQVNGEGKSWSEPYPIDTGVLSTDHDYETGSSPTLMGFGSDDELVVITDGKKQMNLLAFWRDKRKEGQLADRIAVTCGFETLPEFVQSDRSVVILNNGAFVVNNRVPDNKHLHVISEVDQRMDIIYNGLAIGPFVGPGAGVQKFEWNNEMHKWEMAWSDSLLSSIGMHPSMSSNSNVVCVNTYNDLNGWQILGLDWGSGQVVHQINLGKSSMGNGACGMIQYFDNGDFLFNSIGGTMRIKLSELSSAN